MARRMRSRLQSALCIGWTCCGMVGLAMGGGCAAIVDPQANAELMRSLGNTSFTVFPTCVREEEGSYDHDTAVTIGEFLTGDNLAEVVLSDEEVPITGPWHANQAQMLRESAAAFAKYVQDNPIETDYALLAEHLLLGGDGGVGGIHCYILDAEGTIAFVVLLNSHHEPFADANPQTVEDCTDVLIGVLRDDLKPSQET